MNKNFVEVKIIELSVESILFFIKYNKEAIFSSDLEIKKCRETFSDKVYSESSLTKT